MFEGATTRSGVGLSFWRKVGPRAGAGHTRGVVHTPVTTALVLCAGYGTRLRPLTDERPKPLMPLGDRTLLAHIAGRLQGFGIERLILNAHHLSPAIERAATALSATLVHEAQILGTAGGVKGAGAHVPEGERLLVHNGDIVANLDWAALSAPSDVSVLALTGPLAPGKGTVGVDARGNVVRLRTDERFGHEVAGGDYAGICVVPFASLPAMPTEGCLVGDVWLPALRRGHALEARFALRSFIDIGTPQSYLAAHRQWLAGRSNYIAPRAEVAPGVELRRTVIGAGALVRGKGPVSDCVVWPGATLT
ncbi:MAG: sugar phosphate nucleotidyltransferase, partial [Myxococcota bacterium]